MDNIPARRKLLRGSLAAPIVLTVASPSALAVSSFQACLDRAAQEPPQPWPAFLDDPDGRYRIKRAIYRGELANVAGNQDFYETAGRYFPVASCFPDGYSATDFVNGVAPAFLKDRWGLVWVDANGHQVGFGPCNNGGFVVSTSCWTSFKNG